MPSKTELIRCRVSYWCRASACSGSANRRRCTKRPTSLRPRSRSWPMPNGSAPTNSRARHFRPLVLVARQAGSAPRPKPLARRIVVVTGGGSGISTTAQALQRRVRGRGHRSRCRYGQRLCHRLRVSDPAHRCVRLSTSRATYGGTRHRRLNAGAAWQGRVSDIDEATLHKLQALWTHPGVAQNAGR